MTLLLCCIAVACWGTIAVVLLREVRAELWDRSIEREREREWVRHMREVHKRWREERLLADAAAVAETLNQELSLTDCRRFRGWTDQ